MTKRQRENKEQEIRGVKCMRELAERYPAYAFIMDSVAQRKEIQLKSRIAPKTFNRLMNIYDNLEVSA
jgi:hypothetical protein